MRAGSRGPPAAIVAATVAVSFSAVFIRIANGDAATIVLLRMGTAATLLAPFAARDISRARADLTGARMAAVGLSGLFLAGHFLLWTASLGSTSIASSVLLVSLHPVIVTPLGRRLLDERVPPRALAAIALALIGTVVTCGGDLRAGALGGDLLAIGGAVCLAGYLLIGRAVRPRLGVAGYSATVYAVVSLSAFVVAIIAGTLHVPSGRTALLSLALAVVCTLGGHTVYNWALRHVRAATVSIAFLGEPPLAAILGLALLGSAVAPSTVIGGVLILAGVGMALVDRPAT